MTDREAIRSLANILADVCDRMGLPFSYGIARDVSVAMNLSEPAAPTVTREQAEHTRNAVIVWLQRNTSIGYHPDYLPRVPDSDDWPAFFRAVADQLKKP